MPISATKSLSRKLFGLGIYATAKKEVTRSDAPTVKVVTTAAISNDEVKNINQTAALASPNCKGNGFDI